MKRLVVAPVALLLLAACSTPDVTPAETTVAPVTADDFAAPTINTGSGSTARRTSSDPATGTAANPPATPQTSGPRSTIHTRVTVDAATAADAAASAQQHADQQAAFNDLTDLMDQLAEESNANTPDPSDLNITNGGWTINTTRPATRTWPADTACAANADQQPDIAFAATTSGTLCALVEAGMSLPSPGTLHSGVTITDKTSGLTNVICADGAANCEQVLSTQVDYLTVPAQPFTAGSFTGYMDATCISDRVDTTPSSFSTEGGNGTFQTAACFTAITGQPVHLTAEFSVIDGLPDAGLTLIVETLHDLAG